MTTATEDAPVLFATFRAMIADALHVKEEYVVPQASFTEDLHADSLQLVEMMIDMEEAGIDLPIEAAWEIETVGDAYRLYRDHAAPGPEEALRGPAPESPI